MSEELLYTVWIPDGKTWRVLAQYPTRAEANLICTRLKADGERALVTKTDDLVDNAIRHGAYRP